MAVTAHRSLLRSGWTRREQLDSPVVVRRMRSARRALQLTLAALWLLDAVLQFQPHMFTKAFVADTLAPAAQGNPAVIADPMRWVSHLMGSYPAAFNAAFATTQLAIAAGLLWQRTLRAALAASVGWAVGVWWFGEGLGGALHGASPVMGAPGAAVLYGLVAVLVWPRDDVGPVGSVAEHGLAGRFGARFAWPVLWGALAYLFLIPANRAPGALRDRVAAMTGGEPGWLAGIDRDLAAAVTGHSTAASIILAVICDLVAISIFVPRLARSGIVAAAALGALLWVSEAFGAIFTGQGTDPGSGLLLVLVAATFWPLSRPSPATPPANGRTAPSGTPTGHMASLAATWGRRRSGPSLGMRRDSTPIGPQAPAQSRHHDLPTPAAHPRRPAAVRRSDLRMGLLAVAGLLVSGCSAGLSAQAGVSGQATGASMAAGMHMAPGATMPARKVTAGTSPPAGAGPSESARMICSSEIRRDVATALALPAPPSPSATWADHLYTCTYHLPSGPLVLAVKELKDVPTAHSYFDQMEQRLGPNQPIAGLDSLGLPGYQTASGTVIFLKDDKTLAVDATSLASPVGPAHISRSDFAYQIATDILGCWTGK